jgi:hypothetical protein
MTVETVNRFNGFPVRTINDPRKPRFMVTKHSRIAKLALGRRYATHGNSCVPIRGLEVHGYLRAPLRGAKTI